MRKFWGFYQNESYSVGCNGGTVYVYDKDGTELAKFKDFPYAYRAAFMPGKNTIVVKSTEGILGVYDLDSLSLVKKIVVTRIGAQDEGFCFSPDGKLFYNIEKPIDSTRTQLAVYETKSFTKVDSLFAENTKMVLDYLEFDDETGACYVLGFMRDGEGIFDYGFLAVFNPESRAIQDIHAIDEKKYDHLMWYKRWELSGFTEKALPLDPENYTEKTSLKDAFEDVLRDKR
ncbi:YncE family protein [Butyrivibrio proteoclasticus]|uniref:YncE family protein n=1 Tax=Butyrivibrio proteoclasticus TaxID=43305 RepID=UPI000686BA8C|nr:hypothetical protein [Butyrivibrio proteoclasticus]